MRHAADAAEQMATDEIQARIETLRGLAHATHNMKQITHTKALELATSCTYTLKFEIECCEAEWIRGNAREIAEIEMHRRDKTNCGEWLKGWKHEMKRAAREKAKHDLKLRFIARKCQEIDGTLWLNDWQLICEMEKSH